MMKQVIFVFLLCMVSGQLYAQKKESLAPGTMGKVMESCISDRLELQERKELNLMDSIVNLFVRMTYCIGQEEIDSARYYIEKAEELSRRLTDEDKAGVLTQIYGVRAALSHDYPEDLYWRLKAKSIFRQYNDTTSRLYATCIAHIANTYANLGDITNSLIHADIYIRLYLSGFNGEETSPLAAEVTELAMIATCYACAEKYDKAIAYMQQALAITKNQFGDQHLLYATFLRRLALIYERAGKWTEAEELLQNAVDLLGESEGDICGLANWNLKLSDLYLKQGKTDEATKLLAAIIPEYINCYGKTSELMEEIARICWITNNDDEIFYYIHKSFQLHKDKTLLEIGQTYSRYKLGIKPFTLCQTIYEYVVDNAKNAQLDSLAYEAKLFSEGLTLNSDRIMRKLTNFNSDTSFKDPTPLEYSYDEQTNDILSEYEMNATMREQHDAEMRNRITKGVAEIQGVLTKEDIAIEFVVAMLEGGSFVQKANRRYLALLLRKNSKAPKCVILGEEAKLDSMTFPQLQQAVWQAIIDSAQIKEGENIYFAPDGIFYNLPIEYLPMADGRSMSDVYNIFRVSSTRELCFRDSVKQNYSSAVLYGGLKYDATIKHNLYAQNVSGYRGWDNISDPVWSSWRAEERAKYNYLPYTLKEVDSISSTINRSWQVTTYTDVYGDEQSFKALSGNSPSILHVATHGYYITPIQAEIMSQENMLRYGITPLDDRQSVIDYSMERTGLLLAGAQHKLRGDTLPPDAEDGILSAKEISHLDLSNTDLVVLSACRTALGDITDDGVAGLQRGFKIAGVKSILMSLWKVNDAATYLFMNRFYKSLASGKSKQQALHDAQAYLRSYTVNGEQPYSDIHYWGAFILLDAIE